MRAMELVTEELQDKQNLLQKLRGEKSPPRRFAVAPSALYPTMAHHIKSVTKNQVRPKDSGLQMYYSMARKLYKRRVDAFDLVLKSRGDCDGQSEREARAEALEICRLWFTRQLHVETGEKTMTVHILEDRRFSL